MQIQKQGKTVRYRFNSLPQLASWLDATPRTWTIRESETNASARDWDLSAGYTGAWQLARDGWIEGAQRLQRALKALPLGTPAPETKFGFYGHKPSVPRYMTGRPDCMVRRVQPPVMGFGRVLTLIVPVNALAGVSAEHMANFGLGVAQYVRQLEMQGTRVELLACVVSKVSGHRLAFSWPVKRSDQPLDLAAVSFAIGHPAMFRRLCFALRERSCVPTDFGYGQSLDAEVSDIINAPVGAIVLNGMQHADRYARTPEKAVEYVERQIEKAMGE